MESLRDLEISGMKGEESLESDSLRPATGELPETVKGRNGAGTMNGKSPENRLTEAEKRISSTKPARELTFEEKKSINREITRMEKVITAIENRISELEEAVASMDALLSDSSKITSGEVFLDYERVKQELGDAFTQWEKAHEELETWKSKKQW